MPHTILGLKVKLVEVRIYTFVNDYDKTSQRDCRRTVLTISSQHLAFTSNILKPVLQDGIPSISSQFGRSRDFTSNPTVQGFGKFVRVQESLLSNTTYQSLTCSCQGPTAVDIKRLPEPRLEPSGTHAPSPASHSR